MEIQREVVRGTGRVATTSLLREEEKMIELMIWMREEDTDIRGKCPDMRMKRVTIEEGETNLTIKENQNTMTTVIGIEIQIIMSAAEILVVKVELIILETERTDTEERTEEGIEMMVIEVEEKEERKRQLRASIEIGPVERIDQTITEMKIETGPGKMEKDPAAVTEVREALTTTEGREDPVTEKKLMRRWKRSAEVGTSPTGELRL